MGIKIPNKGISSIVFGGDKRKVSKIIYGQGNVIYPSEKKEVLFESENGTIIHDISAGIITITSNSGETITIADKNVGATEYLGQSNDETKSYGDCYCWGGKTPFVTLPTNESEEDWTQVQSIAPEGYHIPTEDELNNLKTLLNTVKQSEPSGNDFKTALLIPPAGYRDYRNGDFEYRGDYAYLWSSTPYEYGTGNAYKLEAVTSYIYIRSLSNRAYGYSVRLFKNT